MSRSKRNAKPVRGSIASYHLEDGPCVFIDEMAKKLSAVNRVPETLTFFRATEISLLARAYVDLKKKVRKIEKKLSAWEPKC